MDADGKTWPLQIVFLLGIIGGAAGLFEPKLFDPGPEPHRTIPWILIAIASVSALILYIPLFKEIFHVRTAIGDRTNPASGTLLARIGNPENPAAGTLLARIGNPENPSAGTLVARMSSLETLLGALGSASNPAAGTLLARIGNPDNPAAGTLLARIGSAGNPEDGTLLARISTLERLCRSREDRLPR